MLQHLDIPPQDLYDGVEDGLWEQTFTLPVDDLSFRVVDLDHNFFAALPHLIGDAAFEQVIAEGGIRRRWGTFKGTYDLSLQFLVRGDHLLVIGLGETSPGRYRLTFQGAWRMT